MPPASQQALYLHQIRISSAVLQFDVIAGHGLSVWKWPVNDAGERVPPSELCDYRLSHRFLGPCCLCPVAMEGGIAFTESAIFMATSGRRAGQYMARCARNSCGYCIHLENVYTKLGVPLKLYPRRAADEPRPEPVVYLDARETLNENRNVIAGVRPGRVRPLRRSYAMADIGNELIPTVRPPPNRRRKLLLQLLQLDSAVRPGLSEHDFRALFAKCGCGLIMTRKAFGSHYCATTSQPGVDIIEITDSEDANE